MHNVYSTSQLFIIIVLTTNLKLRRSGAMYVPEQSFAHEPIILQYACLFSCGHVHKAKSVNLAK